MSSEEKKLLGYVPHGMTPSKIRSITDRCEAECTAREVMQHCTSSWGYKNIENPNALDKHVEAPSKPNGYSDGSLKNPVGNHWAIGGIGIWWPNRKNEEEPLNEQEAKYSEHEWCQQGCMQWVAFNEL